MLVGKWDKKTGHNAPLRSRPGESAEEQILNVDYTWNYLLQLGAVPHKTVLGVPLYGRAFTLLDPTNNAMGAPAEETSFQVRLRFRFASFSPVQSRPTHIYTTELLL